MSILSQEQIKQNIETELADNNAGAISAYDVRHNMVDIVDSINHIVASGDFEATTPFLKNVKIQRDDNNNEYGKLIVGSGVQFPYGGLQIEAYPGVGGTSHNSLKDLAVGDPHLQYMPISGVRTMIKNLGLGNNWINSSGNSQITTSDNRGFKFAYINSNTERINVGSKSFFNFDADNSTMSTAKGVAKAWINFDASGTNGTPVINSYYNIHQLEKTAVGKFKITFTSGILGDNSYIAIGSSNARTSAGSAEDFDVNTIGIVRRTGNDLSTLRSATFCILNDAGEYVDAEINELVVYGRGPNESSGVHPTVIVS